MDDEKKVIVVENITLTGMVEWLNNDKKFVKEGVNVKTPDFTVSDIQQYIKVGHLPYYMGGQIIEKVDSKYAKLYNIVEFK